MWKAFAFIFHPPSPQQQDLKYMPNITWTEISHVFAFRSRHVYISHSNMKKNEFFSLSMSEQSSNFFSFSSCLCYDKENLGNSISLFTAGLLQEPTENREEEGGKEKYSAKSLLIWNPFYYSNNVSIEWVHRKKNENETLPSSFRSPSLIVSGKFFNSNFWFAPDLLCEMEMLTHNLSHCEGQTHTHTRRSQYLVNKIRNVNSVSGRYESLCNFPQYSKQQQRVRTVGEDQFDAKRISIRQHKSFCHKIIFYFMSHLKLMPIQASSDDDSGIESRCQEHGTTTTTISMSERRWKTIKLVNDAMCAALLCVGGGGMRRGTNEQIQFIRPRHTKIISFTAELLASRSAVCSSMKVKRENFSLVCLPRSIFTL